MPLFQIPGRGIQQFSRLLHQTLSLSPNISRLDLVSLRPCIAGKILFAANAFVAALLHRPDFILVTHLHLGRLHPFLKILGIPYGVFCHGIECWDLTKKSDRQTLLHARRIFAVSRYTSACIQGQLPEVAARLSLFPDHVEEPPANPVSQREARKKLDLPPEAKILLTVSRLSAGERYKGHREVLESLVHLKENHPGILFLIVGDGDDRNSLEEQALGLKLEKNVRFTGRLSEADLELAYAASDVFVMPSTGEGFGIVFLEALVRGKAVLAGNRDGSVDPLLDGKLGLLADPGNPRDLLEKLELLLDSNPISDPVFLKREALSHFGPEQLQKRVDGLMKELSQKT